MALTKVQKTGITDNAIDADKIEDGTIVAADIAPGTITNAKLAGSIANDKLANSSITVNGSSVSLGGSVSAGKIQWQSVKTADFNAVAGEGYFVDTDSVGAVTATLPGSPSAGDTIAFKDYAGTFGTNALTIARNGNNIQGVANDSLISTNRASIVLVYIDATKGWLYTNESNVAGLGKPLFTSATGGTITTDGDYKIHVFTGDGCFAVSTVGNSPIVPTGGPNTVEYLVVAGGGAGVGQYSGGGAGGFRTAIHSTPTTNPLNAPVCSLVTVTTTTYPITVGSGGQGYPYACGPSATPGSPSIFSTITSAGGGSGNPSSGGSGAGGQGEPCGVANPGGSGNTPPVSPSQGNPGGPGTAGARRGGGGGGAGAVGAGPGSATGGAGSYVPTTWLGPIAPTTGVSGPNGRYFAGGGGGGTETTPGSPYAGGLGGGGAGGNVSNGTPGSVNTGGAGGSGSRGTGGSGVYGGGAGGSGIVILKYKFQ